MRPAWLRELQQLRRTVAKMAQPGPPLISSRPLRPPRLVGATNGASCRMVPLAKLVTEGPPRRASAAAAMWKEYSRIRTYDAPEFYRAVARQVRGQAADTSAVDFLRDTRFSMFFTTARDRCRERHFSLGNNFALHSRNCHFSGANR